MGGVVLEDLVRGHGLATPTYVYDLDAMAQEAGALHEAFGDEPHFVAYAVKANAAGPVVRTLAAAGCGADVVSGAELALALACGIAPSDIVFSGVAKRDDEIDAALAAGAGGIRAIQLESVEEARRVAARARAVARRAPVSIRVNPGVDLDLLDTHAGIATGHDEAKFGVPLAHVADVLSVLAGERDHMELVALTCHVGSQFTQTAGYVDAARALFRLAVDVGSEHRLRYVDTGGGFGIDYGRGCPVRPADFVREVLAAKREIGLGALPLAVEPGRALVGAHGVLLSRVVQRKSAGGRRWLMIDAGMNDLMRPALYQAHHRVVCASHSRGEQGELRVVGPVCESSDDFGVHTLPLASSAPAGEEELVAILDAGAYGATMASTYNGRALPGEAFLRGGALIGASLRAPESEWVRERLAAGGLEEG